MRLQEAIDVLLDSFSDNPEAASVREEASKLIGQLDVEMETLESLAQILYDWGIADLEKRVPICGPKERARQLLKALHTIKDARLLTLPR
jgi:hypothetical protein